MVPPILHHRVWSELCKYLLQNIPDIFAPLLLTLVESEVGFVTRDMSKSIVPIHRWTVLVKIIVTCTLVVLLVLH